MFKKFKELSGYILPFILAVFIYALITDFNVTLGVLHSLWSGISYILSRFLIGFGMAYMLNFLVEWLRKTLRFNKPLAIGLTYLLFIGASTVLIIFIIPMVIDSVEQIFNAFKDAPRYTEDLIEWLTGKFPDLEGDIILFIRSLSEQVSGSITGLLGRFLTFANVTDFISAFTRSFLNILFGLFISIYALVEKPFLIRRAKNLMYALFPDRQAGNIITVARESNRVFSSFLVGKTLDSLIIGLISLPLYYIFGIPYAPFLALIAGVTNIVPYFGPLAGGVITGMILLFFDPVKALYAILIIIVVQTFDGYVLGPRILGHAVGISPLLTIVAITVGGDLFGFMGIFLGVPAMAVLKTMVFDRFVNKRLQKKIQKRVAAGEGPPPPELLEDYEDFPQKKPKPPRKAFRFTKKK